MRNKTLIERSEGAIMNRFDKLDEGAKIIVFDTSKEVGVYWDKTSSQDVADLRTQVSGDEPLRFNASMSKRQFNKFNMLAGLLEMKDGRPINYYGI